MTPQQYKKLCAVTSTTLPPLTIKNLRNKSERTLLFGYTCERETFHVYIRDGRIYTVRYEGWKDNPTPKEVTVKTDEDYVPDKRVYPTRSDYEFCRLLRTRDVYIAFTNQNQEELKRPLIEGKYFGMVLPT